MEDATPISMSPLKVQCFKLKKLLKTKSCYPKSKSGGSPTSGVTLRSARVAARENSVF
ncbi:Protein of unknown function, partial [Gryllus bimaculatus]